MRWPNFRSTQAEKPEPITWRKGSVARTVERVFEIIGEAMSKMIHRFPESQNRIDNARRIANFRNVIAHEYRNVDDSLVWDIVVRSAPILKVQIDEWVEELGMP